MRISDFCITLISYILRKEKRKLILTALKFRQKKGIEIGGPSNLFKLKGQLPIYLFAKSVDGVNFSNETIWENKINPGKNYQYHPTKTGFQYIAEGSQLDFIESASYDFALSCHSLEHVANPLKAVFEWKRILKNEGLLVLVLPDKEKTFDKNRPYTNFAHLISDYKNNTGEDDSTHFEEVLRLHDFRMDPFIGAHEALADRTRNNFVNRAVHHHVFSLELIKEMLEFAGFDIIIQTKRNPHHLITIAKT